MYVRTGLEGQVTESEPPRKDSFSDFEEKRDSLRSKLSLFYISGCINITTARIWS